MTTQLPTQEQLDAARQKSVWDFGNTILYKLCEDNFKHEQDEHILTKVLFIGRIYAAAVERRKNKSSEINDYFYIKIVAPAFRDSDLDDRLSKLKNANIEDIEDIKYILETILLDIFEKVREKADFRVCNNKEKRCFPRTYANLQRSMKPTA